MHLPATLVICLSTALSNLRLVCRSVAHLPLPPHTHTHRALTSIPHIPSACNISNLPEHSTKQPKTGVSSCGTSPSSTTHPHPHPQSTYQYTPYPKVHRPAVQYTSNLPGHSPKLPTTGVSSCGTSPSSTTHPHPQSTYQYTPYPIVHLPAVH